MQNGLLESIMMIYMMYMIQKITKKNTVSSLEILQDKLSNKKLIPSTNQIQKA